MPHTDKTSLQQFFGYCIDKKLPVACYRLPATEAVKVIAQKSSEAYQIPPGQDYKYQKGFLFSPFVENAQFSKFLIQADIFTVEEKLPTPDFAVDKKNAKRVKSEKTKLKAAGEKGYKKYVKEITHRIGEGEFTKVVAGRIEKQKKPGSFEPVTFFKELCKKYPSAFVSLVYTAHHGLWIGASPEILLNVDASGFKTYSLAGTQQLKGGSKKAEWGDKEKEEQKIVSRYIVKTFKKVTNDKPVITGPETVPAGNLLHLRTTFVYNDIPHSQWQKIVEQLHPTPAVAGLPRKRAIDFIQQHEKSPRGFYCGYLGPVNMDREINLFVNLRCMQVLKNKIAVYVGCGITGDSKPAKEWKESKLKAGTLLEVLESR